MNTTKWQTMKHAALILAVLCITGCGAIEEKESQDVYFVQRMEDGMWIRTTPHYEGQLIGSRRWMTATFNETNGYRRTLEMNDDIKVTISPDVKESDIIAAVVVSVRSRDIGGKKTITGIEVQAVQQEGALK